MNSFSHESRWGIPFTASFFIHLVFLFFISLIKPAQSPLLLETINVVEIGVLGPSDLTRKGVAQDASLGPLASMTVLAEPAAVGGPVRSGNTIRKGGSAASREAAAKGPAFSPPPRPAAKGAIFTARTSLASGIGKEKVYLDNPSAARLMGGQSAAPASGAGEGLVGVPQGGVQPLVKRGTGQIAGKGEFLGGGAGSTSGSDAIMARRGEPILVDSRLVTTPLPGEEGARERVSMPEPSESFFSIRGPLSGRRIVKIKIPQYPRWAEESGVEAKIAVRITVSAEGRVKPSSYIERTSGFPELDALVLETVRAMQFEPSRSRNVNQEEWGIATFNFKLQKSVSRGG